MITHNTLAAIFLAYICDKLMTFYRSSKGEDNISFKTMIDSRFLI